MFDDFLIRAAVAALGVALAAAPLGCFIVWRRMAYVGDATAHAEVLGVALALALQVSVFGGVLLVALAVAASTTSLSRAGFAVDTVLGVLAHSALALGLVAVSLLDGVRVDLNAYLFGDILAVTKTDLMVIWGGGAAIVALVAWRWSALLTATLNPDLAHASGLNPAREERFLMLALVLTVTVSIKVVGALLIGAMLLIPAATARGFARTPEAMALIAAVIGAVAALGGLWAAFELDTPAGPTIVSLAALLFAAATLVRGIRGR